VSGVRTADAQIAADLFVLIRGYPCIRGSYD